MSQIPTGGLFEPIQPLKLSDTFYTWWEATNELSAALNPLVIYDVGAGTGISITRAIEGVATINIDAGCGLKFDGNTLTLDIREATEDLNGPNNTDFFVFERSAGSSDTYPNTTNTTDCETIRKVSATHMLPATIADAHTFSGNITLGANLLSGAINGTSTTHLRSNAIRLGPSSSSYNRSSIQSIGFYIDALDEDPNWIYRGDLLAWYTNQNIGISYDQAFVSDGPTDSTVAKFNFSPKEGNQENTEINLLLGARPNEIITTDTDAAISLRATNATNSLEVAYTTQSGAKYPLFIADYNIGSNYSTFNINGRIFIGDIQNSSQFLSNTDYTANKVPLTITEGVLDFKYTNRFVTTKYDTDLVVGDVVRIEYQNTTNSTEDIFIVAASADTEENSKVVGVVERIANGVITIALTGVFNHGMGNTVISGETYYLSQGNPGKVTSTAPSYGISKEVFVGVSSTQAILFSSAANGSPNFANVAITGDDTVTADAVGDTLVLTAGTNITIEKNTDNEIIISAGTLADANYWTTFTLDGFGGTGSVAADGAEQTLNITGEDGIFTYKNGSDDLVIRGGKSFSTIEIIGMNTNELDYTVEANVGEDTLYLRSGVGISIISTTDNDILIEATGVSVPADGSITNNKLDDMVPFSIKGAQLNGIPTDIHNQSYPISNGGYNVTGGSETNDPEIYTMVDSPYNQYQSLMSVSGNEVLNTAPNAAIAGYVFGRFTAETGLVSNITALGRTELRSIIGAAPIGFLEENSNLFNNWQLFSSLNTAISDASATASSKTGGLNFVAGNNITLTKVFANDLVNGPFGHAIKIDASSSLSGFNDIINTRTGQNLQSGDTSGVLEISDYDAIAIEINSNNGLVFSIKPESITNSMLADMPANTVKVGLNDTDSPFPTPTDLVIGTNSVLGRLNGSLESLNATEIKSILGLTSSYYFKTIKLQDNGGTDISGSTVSANSTSEEFILRAGTNISLSRTANTNTYVINSLGGSSGGITAISYSEIGNDNGTLNNPSNITFGLRGNTDPFIDGNYYNIDFNRTVDGTSFAIDFDLAPMPQYSVKIASPTSASFHGTSGLYPAANLVLLANQILCRPTDANNSLRGKTLVQLAADTGGIPYLTSFKDSSSNIITLPGVGPKSIKIIADTETIGNTISSIVSLSGTEIVYKLSAFTSLITDLTPVLGGNLNVNKKTFIGPSSFKPSAPSGNRTIAEFIQNRQSTTGIGSGGAYFRFNTANTTDAAIISLVPETIGSETAVSSKDITISPIGSGKVNITTGIISTANNNGSFTINYTRNVGSSGLAADLLNQHIYLMSGTSNDVSIGTLGTSNVGKNLNFYASQIAINNSGSKDITFVYTKNNTTSLSTPIQIDRLITRGNDNSIGIFTTNTSGNLILAAGAVNTAGVIPSAGSSSIQFNSNILLSSKAITAADKNITIDVESNDFSGALKLKSTNKFGLYRIKNGSITVPTGGTGGTITGTAGMSSGYLDVINYLTSTEKAIKYFMYIQNANVPSESALVEFNVIINGSSFRSLEIVNTMVPLDSSELYIHSEGAGIVLLTSVVTGTGGQGDSGALSFGGDDCSVALPSLGTNEVGVTLNKCMQGTYNITLHKMSIQA